MALRTHLQVAHGMARTTAVTTLVLLLVGGVHSLAPSICPNSGPAARTKPLAATVSAADSANAAKANSGGDDAEAASQVVWVRKVPWAVTKADLREKMEVRSS